MTCLIRGLCAVFLLASLAHFSPAEAQVTFTHAVSDKVLFELQNHPGITRVEGRRDVPVILRNGRQSHRGSTR